jgi:outer membrane protein assembly factor BamE (lipoprotein component of BamABCDE complex)
MHRALLSSLFAIALTACAGTYFRWEDARKIQQGMTEQQVLALMGNPAAVASAPAVPTALR